MVLSPFEKGEWTYIFNCHVTPFFVYFYVINLLNLYSIEMGIKNSLEVFPASYKRLRGVKICGLATCRFRIILALFMPRIRIDLPTFAHRIRTHVGVWNVCMFLDNGIEGPRSVRFVQL